VPRRGPAAAARHLQTARTFGRWDCINARQRESVKESRFAAWSSLLTSPATRRMPPKCEAFRLQPRSSPSRQTGCWSKGDSNSWSHPERQRSEGATWVPPPLPVSESRPPERAGRVRIQTRSFPLASASQRYAHRYRHRPMSISARKPAVVHPLFFWVANHSTEPGWGTD
jgi:hypothetical protein